MTKPFTLKFEDEFKISTKSLRLNGAHPEIKRNIMWKLKYLAIFIPSLTNFMFLCFSVYHDLNTGKFADVSKNCTMIIVFATINLKYITLVIYQDSIKELIHFLETDYSNDNDYSDEDKETIIEYAEKGANVCKFWFAAGFTGVIFPLKALLTMAYYYWKDDFKLVPMFELTFPEPIESHKNTPIVFWLMFLLQLSFAVYATSMYVGFDPIVPIFILHVSGQIVLLCKRMERVFTESEDPKQIQVKLKSIIIKLQSLYKFMDCIKQYFTVLYEYNLKTTTFLLPFTAFQLFEELRNHRVNVEFFSFFMGTILHFFIPSYYSDHLIEMSYNFRQALYSSGWEKCPDKGVRQIVLFMITRASTPMGIRTVFYEINLDTFAEMCRQAYGILNLLNATWL